MYVISLLYIPGQEPVPAGPGQAESGLPTWDESTVWALHEKNKHLYMTEPTVMVDTQVMSTSFH